MKILEWIRAPCRRCPWLEKQFHDIFDGLTIILNQLDHLNQEVQSLMATVQQLQAAVDDLQVKVTGIQGVEQSAVALLNGLTAKINELIASGQAPDAIVAQIGTLAQQVQASADDLAAGVAANPVP